MQKPGRLRDGRSGLGGEDGLRRARRLELVASPVMYAAQTDLGYKYGSFVGGGFLSFILLSILQNSSLSSRPSMLLSPSRRCSTIELGLSTQSLRTPESMPEYLGAKDASNRLRCET